MFLSKLELQNVRDEVAAGFDVKKPLMRLITTVEAQNRLLESALDVFSDAKALAAMKLLYEVYPEMQAKEAKFNILISAIFGVAKKDVPMKSIIEDEVTALRGMIADVKQEETKHVTKPKKPKK